LPQHYFQIRDEAAGVEIAIEELPEGPVSLKISPDYGLELFSAECRDRPCFSDLPSSPDDERFASHTILPLFKVLLDEAPHGGSLLSIALKQGNNKTGDLKIQGNLI
jgi:hypothetical protein